MDINNAIRLNEAREMNIECIINLYKSIHGIKPRWMDFDSMSDQELEDYLQRLGRESEEQLEFEAAQAEQARIRFDAHIMGMMEDYGIDRETALRWEVQAYGDHADLEQVLWNWGIDFDDMHLYM